MTPSTYPRPGKRVTEDAVRYRSFLTCPHCARSIDMTVKGLDWTIKSPTDIATRLMAQSRQFEQEVLYVVSLNTKNIALAEPHVAYVGNVSSALVRVCELLREPVRLGASGLILAHLHPSGDTTPSPDDLHLTAEVLAGARLLDLDLLDHIVFGRDRYTSLRDRGVTFSR